MSSEKRTIATRLIAWFTSVGLLVGLALGTARGLAVIRSNRYIALGLGNAALYVFQAALNTCLLAAAAAISVACLVVIVSSASRRSLRAASIATGALLAACLCLRLGYSLNRWEFQAQWLAPRCLAGLPLRAGFFEREVVFANMGVLAVSLLAGYVTYLAMRALLRRLAARRALPRRVPAFRTVMVVLLCLVAGSNLYSYLHRARNAADRPNVILISLDTLRADHVGCYGYSRDCTPNLDRIAREGVVFECTYAQAASTLPSHKSLFTSLYPPSLRSNGMHALDPRRVTLTEILLDRGYRTGAFAHGLGWVTPVFGFDQGFDTYVIPSRKLIPEESTAEAVTDHAVSWIRRHRKSPFFAFLHYGDIHSDWGKLPYDAPEPYRSRYLRSIGARPEELTTKMSGSLYLAEVNRGRFCPSEKELAALRALYDAGVRYTDEHLGRLLAALEDMGLAENTMIVVFSDHGERFGEHGKVLHGWVTCEVARVLLLMKFPHSVLAGRRVPGQVELVDVVPTVLEFLGIPPRPDMCGRSLMNVIREGGGTGDAYTEAGRCCAVRSGGWMFAHDFDTRETQVYNIKNDPLETVNVAGRFLDRERELARKLVKWLEAAEAARLEGMEGERVAVDAALRDLLESLGYLNIGDQPIR